MRVLIGLSLITSCIASNGMAAIAQTHADLNSRIQGLKPQITREVQKAESRSYQPKPDLAKAQIELRQYRQFWEKVNPILSWQQFWGSGVVLGAIPLPSSQQTNLIKSAFSM